MAIVTITAGSYSKGQEVAETVARQLGYRCISRETILNASDGFNLPDIKGFLSFQKGPSELDLTGAEKEKCLAYVQLLLLSDYQKDNVVHHGIAGHFFVRGIKHGLKVLVMQDIEDRMNICMDREGLSRKDALVYLKGKDRPIIEWGLHLYGIHPWDSGLYDLAVHLKKIPVSIAADTICRIVSLDSFQTTSESQKNVEELLLSAKTKWALRDLNPHAEVSSHGGSVMVKAVLESGSTKSEEQRDRLTDQIQTIVQEIPGVRKIKIDAALYPIGETEEEKNL